MPHPCGLLLYAVNLDTKRRSAVLTALIVVVIGVYRFSLLLIDGATDVDSISVLNEDI